MAEKLFQAGEAERCLGLKFLETSAKTTLVVKADAAPLGRALDGAGLCLEQRSLFLLSVFRRCSQQRLARSSGGFAGPA